MELHPVKSSNLKAVSYDPATREMVVEFKSGARHRYAGVPPDVYAALLAAESAGSYFHQHIRSRYDGARLGEDE